MIIIIIIQLQFICVCQSLSCVRLFVTSWTIAHQVPLFMEFFRQEFWRELPFPSPGDLPNLGIKPRSPIVQADSLLCEPPGKPLFITCYYALGTVMNSVWCTLFPLILTGNFSGNLYYVLSFTFKDMETEAQYVDIFHSVIWIQAGIQTQPISVPKILNNV